MYDVTRFTCIHTVLVYMYVNKKAPYSTVITQEFHFCTTPVQQ